MNIILSSFTSILLLLLGLSAIMVGIRVGFVPYPPKVELDRYGQKHQVASEKSPSYKKGITMFVLAAVLLACSWYTGTHRFVPTNHSAITINRMNGQPGSTTQGSGIISTPWLGKALIFPANQNFQMCDDHTPSVRGGYEIEANVCFHFDASNIDWAAQFRQYNAQGFDDLRSKWNKEIKQDLSMAISAFLPHELTEDRDQVAQAIFDRTTDFFERQGIDLQLVTLNNWDFTSEEARASYEQTMATQTELLQEENLMEIAQLRQDRELLEAETANLVLETRTQGVVAYLQALGITDQETIAQVLTILYLQGTGAPPENIVLSIGSQTPNIAIPVGNNPAP